MFTDVLIELIVIYFPSFEIFNIQIGKMAFCKPDFIIINSNYYYQNAQKAMILEHKCAKSTFYQPSTS
jgi:hypothetical protein